MAPPEPRQIVINKDLTKICRTCLGQLKLVPIHETHVDLTPVSHLLEAYAWIKVSADDGLPQNICIDCVEVLHRMYEFRKKSHQSEQILRIMLYVVPTGPKSNSSSYQVFDLEEVASGDARGNQENMAPTKIEHGEVFKQEATNIVDEEVGDNCINMSGEDEIKEEILFEGDSKVSLGELGEKTPHGEEKSNLLDTCRSDTEKLENCEESPSSAIEHNRNFEEQTEASCGKEQFKQPTSCRNRKRPKSKKVDKPPSPKLAENDSPKQVTKKPKQPVACPICGKLLEKRYYDQHVKVHTEKKSYKCQICFKAFSWTTSLRRHKLQHTRKRSLFLCELCGQGFVQKVKLYHHMKEHTGIPPVGIPAPRTPLLCDICGKSFRTQCGLDSHLKIHKGDATLKETTLCNVCGVVLTRAAFNVHKKIHSGERPFACDKCGRTFVMKCNFNNHLITHTNERPYKCSHCIKAFSNPSNLKRHVKTVHKGERPYKCFICQVAFHAKYGLKYHMNIHTGETPFGCDACGKRFGDPSSRRKHQYKCCPKIDKTPKHKLV